MTSVLMLDADLEQRVIRFIAQKIGIDADAMAPESRLLHDLGIDGDDAAELLTEYAEAFHVDLTGFDFGRHFRSEPNIVTIWFRKIDHLLPVTVAQLVQGAHVHRWLDV